MQVLKELALIITRNKAKSIETLDLKNEKDSKYNDFYKKLTEGKFSDDDEAAQYYYPQQKSTNNYRKLKAGLKSRMINSLFFLDTNKSQYTDRQTAYYECHKNWAAINILLGKNAYETFRELAKKTLRYAYKYEFTELTRDLLRILRLHYGAQMGDLKNYEHYQEQYLTYERICRWDDIAESHYIELAVVYINNKSKKDYLTRRAAESLSELDEYCQESDSYRLHLYRYLVKLIQCNIENDFKAVYETGGQMVDFFADKPYTAATPIQIAQYYQLMACTQLGWFEKGKVIALKCLDLQSMGSFNWFKYNELYFLLAMHSGEYEEAFLIYKEVVGNSRMKFLPENTKEIWTIYWAYLYYLFNAEELSVRATDDSFSKFRLGRFINQTPIFSKDKRGMNIAILIIQVLLLIQQKKYNVAIDKLEALEKYCARYLHQEETLRSYYFMKSLLCFPKAAFHRAAIERKAKKYIDKLESIPLNSASQTYKIEIIPYEKLWEFTTSLFSHKTYRMRR